MIQTLVSAVAALAGVLLLILVAGRLAKRSWFVRAQNSARMGVIESLALDARRRLVLVSCDGRPLLLLTGTHDQVIGWLPSEPAS